MTRWDRVWCGVEMTEYTPLTSTTMLSPHMSFEKASREAAWTSHSTHSMHYNQQGRKNCLSRQTDIVYVFLKATADTLLEWVQYSSYPSTASLPRWLAVCPNGWERMERIEWRELLLLIISPVPQPSLRESLTLALSRLCSALWELALSVQSHSHLLHGVATLYWLCLNA